MTDENQAVATDESQAAPAEESQERTEPSLDELLNEFNPKEEVKEEKKEQPKGDDLSDVREYVREMREEKARETTEKGISEAIEMVKGEDLDVSDRVVRGMLLDEANRNPRFQEAFFLRHQNPEAWKKVLKSVGKTIRQELNIDRNVSEDREAVAAAVRGSTKPAEAPPIDNRSLNKMSDAEFRKFKEGLGA